METSTNSHQNCYKNYICQPNTTSLSSSEAIDDLFFADDNLDSLAGELSVDPSCNLAWQHLVTSRLSQLLYRRCQRKHLHSRSYCWTRLWNNNWEYQLGNYSAVWHAIRGDIYSLSPSPWCQPHYCHLTIGIAITGSRAWGLGDVWHHFKVATTRASQ